MPHSTQVKHFLSAFNENLRYTFLCCLFLFRLLWFGMYSLLFWIILIECHEHNLQMDAPHCKTARGNKSDLEPKTKNVNIDGQIDGFW